jgi:protocatechuate 4,5-dioxygenase beta chain
VAVVIFNDHGNSFFLDRIPTFAVGCAEEYRPVDEGWGPRAIPPFQGAVDFSWHLIDTLVENRFDPMICQEIEVDHGLQVPMELFWGRPEEAWPVRVVPIFVNVIQFPIPLPSRCYEMGRILRQAIESYESDERFVVVGTGGLSHQLQGARAGFVNPEADRAFLEDIARDPDKLAAMSREDFVEMFGSEGAELMMWLVMRGAMNRDVVLRHKHYYVPASMTGAGMVVLENKASAEMAV